jgi:hypothetical protein
MTRVISRALRRPGGCREPVQRPVVAHGRQAPRGALRRARPLAARHSVPRRRLHEMEGAEPANRSRQAAASRAPNIPMATHATSKAPIVHTWSAPRRVCECGPLDRTQSCVFTGRGAVRARSRCAAATGPVSVPRPRANGARRDVTTPSAPRSVCECGPLDRTQ